MKKILVIVDFQYDFCNPKGALYVPGAEKAQEAILREICKIDENKKTVNKNYYDCILFTYDFHPKNHCSFKENGGEWPTHCVKQSNGAVTNKELIYCANKNHTYSWFCAMKGNNADVEEYGLDLSKWLKSMNLPESKFTICGLAGDYCVLETLKMNMDSHSCEIFLDGIASIDGGKKLNDFIKEKDIKTC